MKSSFKEQFDKYELLVTPFLMIIVLVFILTFLPQMVFIENFDQIFLLPLITGMLIGLIIAYILDKYWKHVSQTNIGDFLKMPSLLLILLSAIGTLFATYNIYVYFSIIGFGLGNMFTFITLASLTVYYRTYLQKPSQ